MYVLETDLWIAKAFTVVWVYNFLLDRHLMNEVVPKLGNYWLFAAGRFSSGLPPIHFGMEVPVYATCGTLAAKVNLMSWSQCLPVRWKAVWAGWERPKRLGLVPITARNLILFYALFDVLFVNLPCSFDTFNTPFILIFFDLTQKSGRKSSSSSAINLHKTSRILL